MKKINSKIQKQKITDKNKNKQTQQKQIENNKQQQKVPNSILFGTGEYTTGYANEGQSKSDKKYGVVALVHFDQRSLNKIGERIVMVGQNGNKFDNIRKHFEQNLKPKFKNIQIEFEQFPKKGEINGKAYLEAIESMNAGDIGSIFTPDDTHFEIAKAAIKKGIHLMITKPVVKTLKEHLELIKLAKKHNVLIQVEVHKRYDPVYADANKKIQDQLGDFSFFQSYMSQPKFQLQTFKSWAGKSSDISYYLNSHHVDFHCWSMMNKCRASYVMGCGSYGVSSEMVERECEDTITLTVGWENIEDRKQTGHATYSASWIEGKSDVHSQQQFFYQGSKGFVRVDQAHRGYSESIDDEYKSVNPFYMKYTTDSMGNYNGQQGYGYQSFAHFIQAVTNINQHLHTPHHYDSILPTIHNTLLSTAILQAGRISLDNHNAIVDILYDQNHHPLSLEIRHHNKLK